MNATGLPIPTVTATPPSPAAEASLTPTAGQAPTDFVLALAQMLGTSVPASPAATALAVAPSEEEPLPTDPNAAALALLPLPIAQTQLQVPQNTNDGDPLEMLGLTARPEAASARDAALLQALTERLAGVVDAPAPEPQVQSGALGALEATQPRSATSEVASHTRPLQHPVGTRAWADEVGSRLTMMTDKGQHTASLRLSPEHLGPLEIRIAMRDDQASVWFGAAHADTRAAIEHALPRLRELFTAQGMSLADAGVFREPPKQQPADWHHSVSNSNESSNTESVSTSARVQVGLLDAYA